MDFDFRTTEQKQIAFIQKVGWYAHNTSYYDFVEDLFSDMEKDELYLKPKFESMKRDFFGFFSSLDPHRKIKLVTRVGERYGK